ncbi:SpoIIE family protein phosphatase/ATP-binding protein [Streptomyces apocyni]|uniref:SpoIIE family protein phosphatase/ATP-binding protein n=1 Tax=Streptomyces apocyni TaxID=2654677 RepID=UPI0012EACE68|nr:SpoIIE family protein phosphatase/ATP-binding protein [Streptomyces apocyni]
MNVRISTKRIATERFALLNVRSAAGQVFVLQVVIVVLLVAAAVTALVIQARRDSTLDAEHQSLTAAEVFAHAPGIVEALESPDPTAVLQPRAEAARQSTDVDFIVVMDTDGIRITHPDPARIGQKFIGTIEPSLAGRTTIETAEGPVRRGVETEVVQAVVPVTDTEGSIVGLVSAGLTVQSVAGLVEQQLPIILGTGAGALALATAGTALVSRRLRRQTHGLGPVEMTRMYEHHNAVLHAVREGVLITTADGRILLANDEARRLLDLPVDAERRHVADLELDATITRLVTSGEPVTDEVHPAGGRLLMVNIRPTAPYGGSTASVVTLRDTTELAAVTGRAEVARERLARLYEAGVRVGTTLDVVRTAEELAELAVPRFADIVTVELLEPVARGGEPTGTTAMRRTAVRGGQREREAMYPVGELITFLPTTPQMRALESGRAVLEPDLREARGWQQQAPDRTRRALESGVHSLVTAPLKARGVVLGLADFWRSGDTPAFDEEDLSFAEELAARAAVAIDNARRFTREHTMAVTLQRSLLPRGMPEQDALEAAWRYRPAEAGVGGDWFDVIPLPGARVALVVGDVVGHGLHAAATMGRLRTAVHNFSALDLPVDELLGHLDDLVTRIDSEESESADGDRPDGHESAEVTGATCLYAIYDPVTGRCTMARAGHPGPAVVCPDGSVIHPDVPASPPLGLGGHPFETAELHLPEGSQLVLYTDGLIENRDRDIGTGLEQLHDVLAGEPGRTPEETCVAVIDAMLPEHPSDDIALLVARTRLLAPSKVAEWEVPADPAAVAPVRAECGAQLRTWGYEEVGFAAELILSELITNAIRYGAPPIKVRLLHNRSLICEVSDGSITSPHLRRAETMDEGGRGLFLVAQFAQRWGTRYTPGGKIIWTEQRLQDGADVTPGDSDTLSDAILAQFDDDTF